MDQRDLQFLIFDKSMQLYALCVHRSPPCKYIPWRMMMSNVESMGFSCRCVYLRLLASIAHFSFVRQYDRRFEYTDEQT